MRKILAMMLSVFIILSCCCALTVSATVQPADLAADYVPGERTGNMLFDADGNFLSSISTNGHSAVTADRTFGGESCFVVGHYKAVNLTNQTANTRACSGAMFSLSTTNGLYANLNPVWTTGTKLVFGATVMSTNSNYEPQINFGFYQSSYPQIMPIEYPSTAAGFQTKQGVYKDFGATLILPEKMNSLSNGTIMEFGFSNTTATAMEVFVPWDSVYLGVEYAYGIKTSADKTNLRVGESFVVDADVINQVGVPGTIEQGVSWYAMNADRTAFVDGFAISESEDGKANVSVTGEVPAGEYYLVAVADINQDYVSGVKVTVKDYADYVPGEVTGNVFENGKFGNQGARIWAETDDGHLFTYDGAMGDGVPSINAYGAYGASFNKGAAYGGYDASILAKGNAICFGAKVKAIEGTSKVTFAAYQDRQTPAYALEYSGACDGMEISDTQWQDFGATVLFGDKFPGASNTILSFGFAETPAGETEGKRSFLMKKDSTYLGLEYMYDIRVSADSTTWIPGETKEILLDADVVNQVGGTGTLDQNVTWYIFDQARVTPVTEGITIVEDTENTGDAKLIIDPFVTPAGTYSIVAISDVNNEFIKGIEIKLEEADVIAVQSAEFSGNTISADAEILCCDSNKAKVNAIMVVCAVNENNRIINYKAEPIINNYSSDRASTSKSLSLSLTDDELGETDKALVFLWDCGESVLPTVFNRSMIELANMIEIEK